MSVILKTETSDSRSTWLEISLENLRDNLAFLKSKTEISTGVLAVVKANAYGHGLTHCAKAVEGGVDYLGVSDLNEAVRLREAGITKPILIFGFLSPEDIPLLLKYDLTIAISDTFHAEKFNQYMVESETAEKLRVHLKIDTGMSRLGFSYRFAADEILKVLRLEFLEIEGIFTHLAVSDRKENPFNLTQVDRFNILLNQLNEEGANFKWTHAANSGGLLNFKESHFNLVRPGISLYGLFDEVDPGLALKPVLSWKTRVSLIKRIKPGDSVSYGRRVVADKPMRIAVIPVGYSHGYPIAASLKAHVLVRGYLVPVLGQVCMDYMVLDIGTEQEIEEGDEVVLIGEQGGENITATQLAEWASTIPYEIVTRLNSSLARVYIE